MESGDTGVSRRPGMHNVCVQRPTALTGLQPSGEPWETNLWVLELGKQRNVGPQCVRNPATCKVYVEAAAPWWSPGWDKAARVLRDHTFQMCNPGQFWPSCYRPEVQLLEMESSFLLQCPSSDLYWESLMLCTHNIKEKFLMPIFTEHQIKGISPIER